MIEGNAARNKRRTPAIGEDRDPSLIDVVPADEVIHNGRNGPLRLVTERDLLERQAGAVAQEVHRKQRHPPPGGVARELEQEFFLMMSGLTDTDDHRRTIATRARR